MPLISAGPWSVDDIMTWLCSFWSWQIPVEIIQEDVGEESKEDFFLKVKYDIC